MAVHVLTPLLGAGDGAAALVVECSLMAAHGDAWEAKALSVHEAVLVVGGGGALGEERDCGLSLAECSVMVAHGDVWEGTRLLLSVHETRGPPSVTWAIRFMRDRCWKSATPSAVKSKPAYGSLGAVATFSSWAVRKSAPGGVATPCWALMFIAPRNARPSKPLIVDGHDRLYGHHSSTKACGWACMLPSEIMSSPMASSPPKLLVAKTTTCSSLPSMPPGPMGSAGSVWPSALPP